MREVSITRRGDAGAAPRWAVAVLAGLVALACLADRAHASEETGTWEASQRGLLSELSVATEDLLRGPRRLYWERGPVLETEKKALVLHLGYEGQFDAIGYQGMDKVVEEAAGERWVSGPYIRRSRIALEGFILRNWYFRARWGWSGFDVPVFQDLFIEWSGLTARWRNWGPTIRVGQVKEPMTMDWMANALRTTFAERAMFTTTIVPNRTPGVRLHGNGFDKRMSYQVGVFQAGASTLNEGRDTKGESFTGRITGLPWAPADHPTRLLHLGISSSWRRNVEKQSFEAKPESWLGPNVVQTPEFDVDRSRSHSLELYFQYDRFSVMAEGARTFVWFRDDRPAQYWGWAGQVSWFLTPPGAKYNRTLACLGRVHPERTLFCPAKSGPGAWEIAARYSFLDLDDGPFPGGRAWNLTLGLSWYARDNIRVVLNYIYTKVTNAYGDPGADGTMNTLMLRLQYDL